MQSEPQHVSNLNLSGSLSSQTLENSKTGGSPRCDNHNNTTGPLVEVVQAHDLPPPHPRGVESNAIPSPPVIASGPAPGPKGPSPATPSLAYAYPPAPDYPALTPILHRSPISIISTPGKGRGVFATEDLPLGYVVDISPVLLLTNEEYYGGGKEGDGKGVEGSVLRGYVFTWKGKEGGMALALGVGSLFNHDISPNVSFELQTTNYTIRYKTFRRVAAGEELCIFYGHRAHFDGDEIANDAGVEDGNDSPWGGLEGVGTGFAEKRPTRKKWDEEIVPFAELEWSKVTTIIDPEDQTLTTFDCWAINVPARHAQLVFSFARKNSDQYSALSHLKRIKKVEGFAASQADSDERGEALIAVVLFPVHQAPDNITELIANSTIAFLSPVPYITKVPATVARTEAQALEWGALWPVTIVHLREGSKALPKAKGWERAKAAWIKREGERVWKAANDAGQRGEHPIACHVTDTFNADVHSPSSLPKTLVRAHDTRLSTANCLSHAASNAIDAVAILDRQGLRAPALLPHLPAPYLLTGLTVFMSHEPCLLCAMSLLHSRIKNLFFIKRAPGSGGCGSVYGVHEDQGLNHRFEVWEWKGRDGELGGLGEGLDLLLDP